jgi:hypothetical protein
MLTHLSIALYPRPRHPERTNKRTNEQTNMSSFTSLGYAPVSGPMGPGEQHRMDVMLKANRDLIRVSTLPQPTVVKSPSTVVKSPPTVVESPRPTGTRDEPDLTGYCACLEPCFCHPNKWSADNIEKSPELQRLYLAWTRRRAQTRFECMFGAQGEEFTPSSTILT